MRLASDPRPAKSHERIFQRTEGIYFVPTCSLNTDPDSFMTVINQNILTVDGMRTITGIHCASQPSIVYHVYIYRLLIFHYWC